MKKILGLVFGLLFVGTAPAVALDPCRNLVDEMKIGSLSGLDGSYMEADNRAVTKNFISVTPDTYYSFNVTGNDFFIYDIYAYDSNKTFLRSLDHPSANNVSVQIPSEGAYIKYSVRKNDNSQVTLNDFQTYMKLASCVQIQVATKKYNDTAFSPVMTALNGAISTIKTVVTNTINQAAAVSALQTGKQTMPNTSGTNGTCPNYKQCLLVETSDGTPQWFVITDPFRDFVTPILATNTNGTSSTNDPGYQQVEYIQSSGTQYIDTGIVATNNIITNCKFKFISSGSDPKVLFGISAGAGSRYWFGERNGISFIGFNDAVSGPTDIGTSVHTVSLKAVEDSENALFIDGTKTNSFSNLTNQSDGSIYLFALHSGNEPVYVGSARVYSCSITQNNTLVRDMVPVIRNSDSAIGMYDKVNGVFYPNANTASGATDFTAGPLVENDPGVPGMTWSVTWSNNGNSESGTVYGEGVCNAVAGTYTVAATSANLSASGWSQSGVQCWCKTTGATVNQESTPVSSAPWMFLTTFASSSACTEGCGNYCATNLRVSAAFRSRLFNAGS